MCLQNVITKIEERTKMKYCPECGNKLAEKQNFCPECGNELSKDTEPKKRTQVQNSEPTHDSTLSTIYLVGGIVSILLPLIIIGLET
jgi:uncharacterized membrane protein YvbJ